MKIYLFILVVLFGTGAISAQEKITSSSKSETPRIIRSNLGMSGSTNNLVTKKGTYYVSQSIGQSSVIGTSFKNGYYLRQGYQQPLNKIKVTPLTKRNNLNAKIYPNPFDESVSVSFDEDMQNEISIQVFDVAGKLVFGQKFSPTKNIELILNNISSGSYLIKVQSQNKLFNAKLIKK